MSGDRDVVWLMLVVICVHGDQMCECVVMTM